MAVFEILGDDNDEVRLVRAPDVGYSLALAGHPRIIEGDPDEAKYDIRIALADLPVEHGLRISEMPDQMDPQALALSLATAYRNTRAITGPEYTVEALPDVGMVEGVIGGAHVLYTRKQDLFQMEYVWVAIHRASNKYQVLYHTVRSRTDDVSLLAWGHLRASFIDQHVWSGTARDITPSIWPESSITRPSVKLDLTEEAWVDARAKAKELDQPTAQFATEVIALLCKVALASASPRAPTGEVLDLLRSQLTTAAPSSLLHVLLRGLDRCRTYHDLRGWAWQSTWVLTNASFGASFRARLRYGNPHAPFGIGAFTVTVGADGEVELVHERGGKRRRWIARAEPALEPTLVAGLVSANFPERPNVRVGRPGTASFTLEVPRPDGTMERASGFPSPNYRDVSLMFTNIVGQMSGDAVLGYSISPTTQYVSDAKEIP